MQLIEFAPTFVAGLLMGRMLSPEWRRSTRWWVERKARGDVAKDAEDLAKLKRKAIQAANG